MGNSSSTQVSGISVNVNASINSDEASVNAQGSIVNTLTLKDLDIFQIGDSNVLRGARNLPKAPHLSELSVSKAFLAARAPFSYEIVGPSTFRQIKKIVRPVKTEILKVYAEPAIAARRKFTNNSSIRGKYKIGVTHEENNTLSTKWTSKIDFNVDLKIDYKIIKPEGSGEVSFKSSWCKETHKYESVVLGSETALEVELEPGQSVVAKLRVTRCVMDVKVTYEACLEGDVICLYESFWRPFSWHYVNADINDVMRGANLPTAIHTSEVLTICFSTDGEILMSDN